MTTIVYLPHFSFIARTASCMTPCPCKCFVRTNPCCSGRMADDPPPPPYMAAILQQFDLNRQFMARVMAQLPNHNAPITLQEFVRLNPSVFRSSANSMDADGWLREIAVQMESAVVAPDCFVTFATYHLRGPAAQWWESHKLALPYGTVSTWQECHKSFRAWHIPQGMMPQKKEHFH